MDFLPLMSIIQPVAAAAGALPVDKFAVLCQLTVR
jgi:hypothetical protein